MIVVTILLLSLKEFLLNEFTMILVLLMFILDGISILLAKDIFKIAPTEFSLAIMLGMIIRVLIFLITQKEKDNETL